MKATPPEGLGLTILVEEPISRHVAWRTGGPCRAFVVAHDEAGLVRVLDDCRAVDVTVVVVGAGSRTVFRDGGLHGIVVRLGTELARVEAADGGLYVGAGAPCPAVAAGALVRGLGGVEELALIPGAFGSSLVHDEGPPGGWAPIVASVRHVWRGKVVETDYPTWRGRGTNVVVGARLALGSEGVEAVQRKTDGAWRKRRRLPPLSWYAVPPKGELRPLLANLSLPGVRLRRVNIPSAAPELLVNLGEGTAEDLSLLHKSVLERVERERGVELTSRIRFAGLPAADERRHGWTRAPESAS